MFCWFLLLLLFLFFSYCNHSKAIPNPKSPFRRWHTHTHLSKHSTPIFIPLPFCTSNPPPPYLSLRSPNYLSLHSPPLSLPTTSPLQAPFPTTSSPPPPFFQTTSPPKFLSPSTSQLTLPLLEQRLRAIPSEIYSEITDFKTVPLIAPWSNPT